MLPCCECRSGSSLRRRQRSAGGNCGHRIKTTGSYAEPTEGNETYSVTITMANGTKSRTVTNLSGQVISESTIGNAADGEITKTYGYAEDGTLSKETDAAGNYRTYEYDSLNRQIAINYFDAEGVQALRTEFSYGTDGNVSEMKDYAFENGSKTLYRWTDSACIVGNFLNKS